MSKDTGGPAFQTENERQTGPDSYHYPGMTVRDYFATHASYEDLRAQCEFIRAKSEFGVLPDNWSVIARYMHADAMLAERNK